MIFTRPVSLKAIAGSMKVAAGLTLLFGLCGCSLLKKEESNEKFVIEKQWVISTLEDEHYGFRMQHRMTPIVGQDLIIQGNALDGIIGVDRKTASIRWRQAIENGVEAGAVRVDDIVYFGASDGYFYALDALTGQIKWRFPIRSEGLGEPLVQNGVVYFEAGNHIAYALNAKTGKQIWLYNRRVPSNLSIRGSTKPEISGDLVYFGFADGYLVALNKASGSLAWEKSLNSNKRFKDVDASPVVEGGRIYVSSYDDSLYCLNANNGQEIWQIEGGGAFPVTLSTRYLYYATTDRKVVALDKKTGQTIWTYSVKNGLATQPVLYKNLVAFGETEGPFRVLNAFRGEEVGNYHPGRGVTSTPWIDPETGEVYFISLNANLFALRMQWKKPQERWPWLED